MKASYPLVVLAWLVGVGIVATGIGALHARSHTSPGYFVAESVVTDHDSPAYTAIRPMVEQSARLRQYIVEGVSP